MVFGFLIWLLTGINEIINHARRSVESLGVASEFEGSRSEKVDQSQNPD